MVVTDKFQVLIESVNRSDGENGNIKIDKSYKRAVACISQNML